MVVGLDTSNYRTSIALVTEEGKILLNFRKLLPVPTGERGIRQNEAVFAHLKQLSEAAEEVRAAEKGKILAVAASTAPRDGAESYMPVFMAGASYGRLAAAALGVPMAAYAPGAFSDCDTVVDCLLGTGFQGSLREPWLGAVEEINACGARVVSVDINSGMNGDTGEAETAVCSDLTVTVGFVKRGLVTEHAGRYMKRLVVADIGIVLARREAQISPAGESGPDLLPCPPWLDRSPIDVRDASEENDAR